MERRLVAIRVADVIGYSRHRGSQRPFMRRLFTFLLLALTTLPTSAMADVGDVTNDTVIALLRAGLSDEAIIAVVDRPRTDFDVEPEALIRLREEGLSNAVIVAIIAAEKRARPAETPSMVVPSVAVELPVISFELMFWDSIKHSTSAADYEAYLLQYPYGHFTTLAVARLETMRGQAAATAAALQAVPQPAPEPQPTIVPQPTPRVIDAQALMDDRGFFKSLNEIAKLKYRIEIERLNSVDVTRGFGSQAVVDLRYYWGNEDDFQRVGHGEATIRIIGGQIAVTEFLSIFPSPIQHLRNSHGASGL